MKCKAVAKGVVAAAGLLLFAAGCAHTYEQAVGQDAYPSSTNQAYLTGSYLPQDVNRSGPVTNGKNDVRVLDRSDINRSGGADVGEALRRQGVTP